MEFSLCLMTFRNSNCLRQLSADSITPAAADANSPSSSHANTVTQNDLSRSMQTSNATSGQSPQTQQQQKSMGNLVSEFSSLDLVNNCSSNSNTSTNTNHTNGTPAAVNPLGTNATWQQTSPNGHPNTPLTNSQSAANSPLLPVSPARPSETDGNALHTTPRPIDVHQRQRRSSRNSDDPSRRSSRSSRQSTSNAPAVNLVRNFVSGSVHVRPTLNLPPGYGKKILNYSKKLLKMEFDFNENSKLIRLNKRQFAAFPSFFILPIAHRNENNTTRSSVFLSHTIGRINMA